MKKYIFCLLLLSLIVGCKQKESPKYTYNATQQFVDVELETWKNEFKKPPFILKISQLPNPFRPPAQVQEEKKGLQALGIKLVGIIKKRGRYYALVEDQNKVSYLVSKNENVGNVKVIDIKSDYIIVKQKIITPMGKIFYITKKVSLTKE
ncbi:MAG: pilus assembly protein PilP [Thermodesulfobacteria bacterium]|nr:pilus assembly protein PilP [Thermodesulfobacteriota bacterium]